MHRNNNFDILRFFAASMVLLDHSFPLSGHNSAETVGQLTGIYTSGDVAVAIFFSISGYLITASMLGSKNWLDYLLKRALRIFPGLALVTVVSVLVFGPLSTTMPLGDYFRSPETHSYLWNIALDIKYSLPGVFQNNAYSSAVNGSLWTLPVEFSMYIIVLALGLGRALNLAFATMVTVAFWVLFYITAAHGIHVAIWGVLPLKETAQFGAIFFAGSCLFFATQERSISWLLAVCGVAVFFAACKTPAMPFAFMIAIPVVTIWAAKVRAPALHNFGRTGDFSYGLYIFAFPIQQLAVKFLGNSVTPLQLFAVAYPVTLLAAFCSWHLVEKHAIAAKRSRPFKMLVGVAPQSAG
jgi:peptidoglycan/LPS O-acetylase OafA/YrhL